MVVSGIIPLSIVAGNAAAFGVAHAPIHIDGNADFAAQASGEGWAGDGSFGNPYIIADYDIDTSAEVGITIANTDVYFVISSVNLALSFYYLYDGMELTNVSNGLITGVVSQGNWNGVMLTSCSNMAIQGGAYEPLYGMADFTDNVVLGLLIQDCDNIDITGVLNTEALIAYVNTFGMHITNSRNISLADCDISSAKTGIYVSDCQDVTINNVIANYNLNIGINVRNSIGVQITDTIANNNKYYGISLYGDPNAYVSGTDATPSTLQAQSNRYDGISATRCSNLTLSGGEFFSNLRSGVSLVLCDNPQILNSQASANGAFRAGITLRYCTFATLINDRSIGNLYASTGFILEKCDDVMMSSCAATTNDGNGMYIKSGKNISVDASTFTGNFGGNGIYSSRVQNLILNDIDVSSNGLNGLFLLVTTNSITISSVTADSNGQNGVHLVAVPNAAIIGGSMSTNLWNGIYLRDSSPATIDGATADYNSMTGIYAAACRDLLVYGGTSTSNNGGDGIFEGVCIDPTVTDVVSTGNSWWGVRSLVCSFVNISSSDLTGNGYGATYWPNSAPTASFTLKRFTMITEPTVFDASASYDDDPIAVYQWNFGDGNTATLGVGQSITTHQYATMDNYYVTLSVRDADGLWSAEVSQITAVQTNISAKIIMPDQSTVGKVVALSAIGVEMEVCKDASGNPVYKTRGASYHTDPLRTIVNYTWNFDDGSPPESGAQVTHSWAAPGSYDVELRAQDDKGYTSPVSTSRIYISATGVSSLSLELGRHSLFPGETTTLKISAVDGAGALVSSCTSTIEVTADKGGWTGLPATVSLIGGKASIVISCTNKTNHNISAEVQGDPSIKWYEHATVADRTVEITVYGLGEMPLGSDEDVYIYPNMDDVYWSGDVSIRGKWGDYPLRFEAMALHEYLSVGPKIGGNIDTTDYMHVEARNLSEVNMASMMFFPRLNTGTGGQVSFTWEYYYMNLSEFWWWNNQLSGSPKYPQNNLQFSTYDIDTWGLPTQFSMYSAARSAYDGWESWTTIDITMDESAAWQMIGMPSYNFTTDPIDWWQWINWTEYKAKNQTVMSLWETEGFMVDEGGSESIAGRLDIKSCDDTYSWSMGHFGSMYKLRNNYDGTITMTIERVGYGEDTLLARWLYWGGVSSGWNYPNGTPQGIVPWEPYYDRFSMSGNIDDVSADITFDAGSPYAWRAQKSADPNVPANTAAWRWEQLRIDYAQTTGVGTCNRSEMDLWYDNGATFDSWDPAGISWPRLGYAADQSPNIVYLDVGESLIIERPRTVVSGIAPVGFVGDATKLNDRTASGYDKWILINEKWGNATVHPLGCYPGTSVVDKGTGDLVMVGPFVPMVEYYTEPGLTWLHKASAPLIEYWVQ